MTKEGRDGRVARIKNRHSGTWASSSQDYADLARRLYDLSEAESRKIDGNFSRYTWAAIPMLMSALRCLLIELNEGVYTGWNTRPEVLDYIAPASNDVSTLRRFYAIPAELLERLDLLVEVRHELLHPAPTPGPEADGTPQCLRSLRDQGLLQSTGQLHDYVWLAQLQSHRLLRWAFATIQDTVNHLLTIHVVKGLAAEGLSASYTIS